jgi:hypothetical protein
MFCFGGLNPKLRGEEFESAEAVQGGIEELRGQFVPA